MIYCVDPEFNEKTGATQYYNYISKLLKATPIKNLNDFFKTGIKRLTERDTIVNTIGLAQLFHYFRELYGLKFRIIRDVQTSLHASYILQEMLVQDFIKKNDMVLFPSHFTRQLYIKLFSHINENNSFVCYPILNSFPEVKREKPKFRYGYIGKVAPEKNFDAIIDFALLTKEKILVAGSTSYPRSVFPKNIVFLGHIDNVWEFYKQIEVLLFPSTANIESLGRVVLEANHCNVKVIAAEHGASPEICKNLVKVKYKREIEIVHNHALGYVKAKDFIIKNLKASTNENYIGHENLLLNIIDGKAKKQETKKLNKSVSNFIDTSRVTVNNDFKYQKIYILKEMLKEIKRSDYRIGKFSENICRKINFIPKWKRTP